MGGRKEIYTFEGTFFITFCTSLSINWLVCCNHFHFYPNPLAFYLTRSVPFCFLWASTLSAVRKGPRWHCRTASCQRLSAVYHDSSGSADMRWAGWAPSQACCRGTQFHRTLLGSGNLSLGPGNHFDCPLRGSSTQFSSEVGLPRCHYGTQLGQLPHCDL